MFYLLNWFDRTLKFSKREWQLNVKFNLRDNGISNHNINFLAVDAILHTYTYKSIEYGEKVCLYVVYNLNLAFSIRSTTYLPWFYGFWVKYYVTIQFIFTFYNKHILRLVQPVKHYVFVEKEERMKNHRFSISFHNVLLLLTSLELTNNDYKKQ